MNKRGKKHYMKKSDSSHMYKDGVVRGMCTFTEDLVMSIPCHRIPERSLKFKGKPMRICARCFAMLIGYLMIPILISAKSIFPLWLPFAMSFPLLLDGFTQRWKWRVSTNTLRFSTGLMFGLGQSMFISSVVWVLVEFLKQ